MWTSHTRRRQSSRLLTVKVPGECLTFLIVRKIHGKDDGLLVLIVFKFRRLATVAIEAAENPAAERRTVTVRIDDPPDVCSRAKVRKRFRP